MLIKIGNFNCSECWDGVFYKKLSDYPNITEWEIQTITGFANYEAKYGRTCEIEVEKAILKRIEEYKAANPKRVPVPQKITECTTCPKYKGCMTDFVCHTSPVENALKILDCGVCFRLFWRGESPQKSLKPKKETRLTTPRTISSMLCSRGEIVRRETVW